MWPTNWLPSGYVLHFEKLGMAKPLRLSVAPRIPALNASSSLVHKMSWRCDASNASVNDQGVAECIDCMYCKLNFHVCVDKESYDSQS